MKAYQLTAWQSQPELREVAVPEPGPGQVLLKVGGAGACHSDLHLMEWPEGTLDFGLPFTLGHENAGWVEALGAGVEGLEIGEAVAVYGPWGCGRCRACRLSAENYCERQAEIGAFGGGLGLDGGMAEYMLVPHSRLLLPLGDLDPARRGAALRRGPHALPRDQALAAPARAGLDRGRDRRRRPRPHGRADPARPQPGPHDRGRHLRREARPGARGRRRRGASSRARARPRRSAS